LPIAPNVHIAGVFHIVDFGFDAGAHELLLENLIFFFLAGARDNDHFQLRADTRFLQQCFNLTKRHEEIWTGSPAITLTMYSTGYDLTRSFAANCRLQWVPRGITLKNSWLVLTPWNEIGGTL
jgi:hypothetical protein